MTLEDELKKAKNIRVALLVASARFVQNELDLSATFARVALSAVNEEVKRERARANAKKAYSSALHFSLKLELPAPEAQDLAERFRQLRSLLELLGETDLTS